MRANITGTPTIFGGFRQPIQINVQGPEQSRLKVAAAQVMEALRDVPGVAEPTSSDEGEVPQLDNLDPETGLVTFSIGGNDANFSTIVKECALGFELLPFKIEW